MSTLMPLNDLRERLDAKFSNPQFDLSNQRLLSPGFPEKLLRGAEKDLDTHLPRHFFELLRTYDLSRFSLAGLMFEYGEKLRKFIEINLGKPYPWWGAGNRPQEYLLVASTDGHLVLLSTIDGRLFAVEKSHKFNAQPIEIAHDFEHLIHLAGDIAVACTREDRLAVAEAGSNVRFWKDLARGFA